MSATTTRWSKMWVLLTVLLVAVEAAEIRGHDHHRYQHQIDAANGKISAVNVIVVANSKQIGILEGRVNNLRNELHSLVKMEVDRYRVQVEASNAKIAELSSSLSIANGKIAKLQSINTIWIKNWKVVVNTFAELRKKTAFPVPALSVVPVNYFGRRR